MPNEIILPVEDPETIELEMEVEAGVTIKAPIDSTLTMAGVAADAKAAGELIRENAAAIEALEGTAEGKVPKPATEGMAGQLLQTNGDGTTQWTTQGTPTAAQVEAATAAWLAAHPEATTTVQDGAVGWEKLSAAMKLAADTIPGTTQKPTFTTAGVIQQIIHEGAGGAAVRTDVFTVTSTTITEVRTLATGQKLTLTTTLATKQTSIVYSET